MLLRALIEVVIDFFLHALVEVFIRLHIHHYLGSLARCSHIKDNLLGSEPC